MRFQDRVVMVTGASSGIGAALARRLIAEGAWVVLAARREHRMDEVLAGSAAPDRGLVVPVDVCRHEDLERLVERAVDHFGRLDALVNNAGLGLTGALQDLLPHEIDALVRLNLLAPIQLTRLALPALRAQPEAMVVNVSSMAGLAALPLQAVYGAAKAAVGTFGVALRRELHGTGVRVLTVYPAMVETDLTEGARERAAELGMRTPVHTAAWAAQRIHRAMQRERRTVVVGGLADQLVAAVSATVPRLLDGPMHRLRPRLAELAKATNPSARLRLPEGR